MDVTIPLQAVYANEIAHGLGIIALAVLAAIAWGRDPSCPECGHCSRAKREKERKERTFSKHVVGDHSDCDHPVRR